MSESTNTDQYETLVNALRQPGFRFILVEYNHLSVYDDVRKLLKEKYPEQPQFELRISGNDYHSLTEMIKEAGKDWVMIPDFDLLFTDNYTVVCTAFNQRRDFFAKNNTVLICFISKGILKQVPLRIPDFWSLRSLELSLENDSIQKQLENIENSFVFEKSSFGGTTDKEKREEIERLLLQVKTTESSNLVLLQNLYSQLADLYFDTSEYAQSFEHTLTLLYLCKKNNNKFGEGWSYNKIGQIHFAKRDYLNSLGSFEQSLKILNDIGDNYLVDTIRSNIIMLFRFVSKSVSSIDFLENFVSISRKFEDKMIEGLTLDLLSNLCFNEGNITKGTEYLKQSIIVFREFRDYP